METLFSELKSLEICNGKKCKIDVDTPETLQFVIKESEFIDSKIYNKEVEIKSNEVVSSNNENKHEVKSIGTGVLHTTSNTSNKFIKSTQEIVHEKQMKELEELGNIDIEFPYRRAKLLTDAELQLFNFMKNNLCQIDRIEILAKVRLADIAEVDNRITMNKEYLWKITNKHIDFLICEKNSLDIICAVELDDYTHESQEAKDRDMFIMQVLDTVGVKTVRIKTKIRAIERRDLVLIDDYINRRLAPKCQYCGKQMYPKISRDGHRFYACEDFIKCRQTRDIDPRGERLP